MDNTLQHTKIQATSMPARLAAAMQSARAVDAPLSQLEYVLAQAMAKAFADMGQKINDRSDEITYLVQNMPAQVISNLPAIRLNEIPIAINRGVMRHFGDFYGLNVATFMRFLMAHYQCAQRAEALKNLPAPTPTHPCPTPAEQQQTRVNRITLAFAKYKADGFYNDYGNLVFDSINALGKIPFGEEQEAQMLAQARQNLVAQYSGASLYADTRAKLKANLDKVLSGNGQNLIITEAKRIALFTLFDDLIKQGLDVLEFLEESPTQPSPEGRAF